MTSQPSPSTQLRWRRDATLLFAVGVAVIALAAAGVRNPGYVDAYYYFNSGVHLARGHGLVEPYLWNYLAGADQPVAPGLWPSHLYWMPLASLLPAPFMALAEALSQGPLPHDRLFRAAQVPFILVAALLPLLSYAVAAWLTGQRRHALGAGLLTLFTPFYFVYWPNTESFALFGLAAATSLACGAYAGSRPDRPRGWLLLAGGAAGAAHLARADGLLVLLVLLGWLGWQGRPGQTLASRACAAAAAWLPLCVGYLLIMGPWLLRNWQMLGAPLPPYGARTLWLRDYDEFFSFNTDGLTLANYIAAGWPAILSSKLAAFQMNLATLGATQGAIAAAPFIIIGLWRLRRCPPVRLAVLYAVSLFLLMTFVFTYPGMRGGFFHSGTALLPFFYPAAYVGLDATVEAAARGLPHWRPERSKRVFGGLLLGLVLALTGTIYFQRVLFAGAVALAWGQRDRVYAEVGAWLEAAGGQEEQALVAVNNPPGWYYFTQQPSIVIPNGGPDELLDAMKALDARWVVLEENHPAGLRELYRAPEASAELDLRASFADSKGSPVYLLELVSP